MKPLKINIIMNIKIKKRFNIYNSEKITRNNKKKKNKEHKSLINRK
jgi:hypothetical protein